MAEPNDRQEKMAEAYRRGILPDEAREKYEEAMRRGLVPDIREAQANEAPLMPRPAVKPEPKNKTIADRALDGGQWVVDGLTTAAGTLPFSHELGGATNAVISAGYNLPGTVGDIAQGRGVSRMTENVSEAYDNQVKSTRGTSFDFQRENPVAAPLIKGTAYGMQGVGIAKQIPTIVGQTGNLVKDVLRGGAVAGAESAAWSWLYGFGDEKGGSFDERIARANDFAKWGAAIGAPIGAAIPAAPVAADAIKRARKNSASGQVLEMARQSGSKVSSSSVNALIGLLKRAGYSRKDVNRGISEVVGILNGTDDIASRASIGAVELQKRFPAASQQIEDVTQQLATAPPKQGNTSQTLLGAIDDQTSSQNSFLDDVFQDLLGVTSIADEQAVLAAERKAIGNARDKVIQNAPTDRRVTNEMKGNAGKLLDDITNDSRARPRLQQAARELGHGGSAAESIAAARAANPFALLQKFGQIARESSDDVVKSYRSMAEDLWDDLSRMAPRTEHGGFGKQVPDGQQGPYKAEQQRFAKNYSHEKAMSEASGRFAAARDPVKADEFVRWYNTLPEGEQRLVQTVIRQDMEKMLRGGNIDDAAAYMTNLRKQGIHDVLVRVLGKDGEDISRAIQVIADEQPRLAQIDPRAGMQNRVVKGKAADDARLLYTNNPISRVAEKTLTPGRANAIDIGVIASSGVPIPYAFLARQGLKAFRPGTRTREGLANILAMRPQARGAASRPKVQSNPSTPPPQASPIAAPAVQNALAPPPAAGPKPLPAKAAPKQIGYGPTTVRTIDQGDLIKPQEQNLPPLMKEQIVKKRMALLDADETNLPPAEQVEIIQRRESWAKPRVSVPERVGDAAGAVGRKIDDAYYGLTGDLESLGTRLGQGAAAAVWSSPLVGLGAWFAYDNWKTLNDGDKKTVAASAARTALERIGPSLKPDLAPTITAAEGAEKRRALEAEGVLISEDGRLYFDRKSGGWQPIENLDRR